MSEQTGQGPTNYGFRPQGPQYPEDSISSLAALRREGGLTDGPPAQQSMPQQAPGQMRQSVQVPNRNSLPQLRSTQVLSPQPPPPQQPAAPVMGERVSGYPTPVHPTRHTAVSQQQAAPGQQPPAPTQQQQQVAPAQSQQVQQAQPPAPVRQTSSAQRVGLAQTQSTDLRINDVLRVMYDVKASDLHLTTGAYPMMRRNGVLEPVPDTDLIEGEGLQRALYAILTQRQREKFEANLELDFSYSVPGLARFRVNFYRQRESVGAAFRVIPFEIKPLEALGVPAVVANFASLPRGLVLVTGPTGSGKSTTLASIVDLANRTRAEHIMTVEDPIEFLHEHKKAIINQREVGADTHTFASALKHVLRQDPDIILVGELRDLETISVALTAAETGHLVFATLHTQDAAQTVDRMIDVFPPEQQSQVRMQLAGALQGVVSQTLCRRSDGPGRVVATEVLLATPAIRNLIREGKSHQIYSAMQAGLQQGMHTMDQHLADLARTGKISHETGLEKCHNLEDYNRLTGRGTGAGAGFSNANMGSAGHQNGAL